MYVCLQLQCVLRETHILPFACLHSTYIRTPRIHRKTINLANTITSMRGNSSLYLRIRISRYGRNNLANEKLGCRLVFQPDRYHVFYHGMTALIRLFPSLHFDPDSVLIPVVVPEAGPRHDGRPAAFHLARVLVPHALVLCLRVLLGRLPRAVRVRAQPAVVGVRYAAGKGAAHAGNGNAVEVPGANRSVCKKPAKSYRCSLVMSRGKTTSNAPNPTVGSHLKPRLKR